MFRMRLERIKRNEEYLATLGLEGNSARKPAQTKKKRRKSVPAEPARPRSSLSRRTKTQVSYVPQPLRIPNSTLPTDPSNQEATAAASAKKKKDSSKTPRKASQRMDRGIYDEFKRIGSRRKQLLRLSKKNVRMAERELKHWARQARRFAKKDGQRKDDEQRSKEIKHLLQANEEQRQALGCTSLQLLQEIDQRNSELSSVVIKYEDSIKVRCRSIVVCCRESLVPTRY
jgi:hypothetical protein